MLVTLWLEGGARETRDADFLGFGEADEETLKQIFAEIMAVPAKDGLVFDTDALIATAIREDMEYGRSVEHTSELKSLLCISYAVLCLINQNVQDKNITILKYIIESK